MEKYVSNIKDGEFGFTNVGGVLLNGVERGDIVVVTMEENGQKTHWVKRVIGLPGETVSCVNDVIYINGKALDETKYIDPDYRQKSWKSMIIVIGLIKCLIPMIKRISEC